MDVSVIIVNYNTSVLIKNLLDSLFEKTTGVELEVIVVDNNPTEQFAIDVKDYLDTIIYLPLKENVGFGRANNEGIRIAKGRNIFFLNPDTLLVNNAIQLLSDYLDKNKQVGVCGGNLYDEAMHPIHSFVRTLPNPLWHVNDLLGGIPFKLAYKKNIQHNFSDMPLAVGYVTGADMMVKRTVLDAVGTFDKDFFMYYEETELSYRIKKAGYCIVAIPDAKIIHLEGQSCETSEKRERMKSLSKKIYYQKTQSLFAYHCSNALAYMNAVLRLVYAQLKGDKKQQEYWSIIKDNL